MKWGRGRLPAMTFFCSKVKGLIMRKYLTRLGLAVLALGFIYNGNIHDVSAAANIQSKVLEVPAKANNAVNSPMIKGIRLGDDLIKTRIVLDLTSIPEYAITEEDGGKQLKILMFNTISDSNASIPAVKGGVVTRIFSVADGPSTMLTIDLKDAINYKAFVLKNPNRLVIDVNKEYEQVKTTAEADGLTMIKYFHTDAGGPVTAWLLDVDPSVYDVKGVLAGGSVSSGRFTVKNIASTNKAAAAVNGGYFSYNGELIGVNKLNGKTAGTTYFTRSGWGIMADGSVKIGKVAYGGYVTINGITLPVSGVDSSRGENNLILYNSNYGKTTNTNEFGMEYTIRNGKVISLQQSNSVIPSNATVVSVHGTSKEAFKDVKVGDEAEIYEVFEGGLEDAVSIIGAGPELLRNGKIHVTAEEEEFPDDIAVGKAPRTAMGLMSNGHIMLAVIDGRQEHSRGTTLEETAALMKRFGAVDAINLDGGGSSEMVVNNAIVNKPSDGGERPVASGVVVVPKNGAAVQWYQPQPKEQVKPAPKVPNKPNTKK